MRTCLTGAALGATTSYSFPVGDDRVETHTLNRDGTWTVTVEDVKARRMRESGE